MMRRILGWDVGGANLKGSCVARGAVAAVERSFALWRDPARLPALLAEIADALGGPSAEMALTMTAELADCFATRREGVLFVLDAFRSAFPDADVWVYGRDGRFRTPDMARREPLEVASANWRASAARVAVEFSDVILLDVGSTTTDVVPIVGGRVMASGRSDTERLVRGELVYTGALRTPVAAIVPTVPLGGRVCRVAAEVFAVAADVHLWLGRINASEYTCETPDGRGRSRSETRARLARMICADAETLDPDRVTAIARHVADRQTDQIAAAIRQVADGLDAPVPDTAAIGGTGAFLARAAAESAGLRVVDLAGRFGRDEARLGPALAVAHLLGELPGR